MVLYLGKEIRLRMECNFVVGLHFKHNEINVKVVFNAYKTMYRIVLLIRLFGDTTQAKFNSLIVFLQK